MSIRKGNYGKNGSTFGKVDSVTSEAVVLITPTGKATPVARNETSQITFGEYKSLTSKGPSGPTGKSAAAPAIKAAIDEANKEDGGVFKSNSAGINVSVPVKPDKKGVALAVYAELTENGTPPTRKAFSTVMADRVGLSAKGSSTYFYNVKNGKWPLKWA